LNICIKERGERSDSRSCGKQIEKKAILNLTLFRRAGAVDTKKKMITYQCAN